MRNFDKEQFLVVPLSIDAVIDLIRATRDRVATKKWPQKSGHKEVATKKWQATSLRSTLNLGLEL